MRVVCALVAALVFLATSHALSLAPSTERGPVVLWSGTDALVAKGAQCFEPVETAHLVAALDALAGVATDTHATSPLASFVHIGPRAAPATLLFFLTAPLDVAHFSQRARAYDVHRAQDAGLQSTVRAGHSSLALPYASVSRDFLDAVVRPVAAHVRARHGDSAPVWIAGETMTLAQLEARLGAPLDAPAVLVVLLRAVGDGDAAQDATVERVDALVNAATRGNYVAVFAGSAAPSLQRASRQPPTANGTGAGAGEEDWINYFPTYVWAWLLVVVTLVLLFGMAIKATSDLQVPPKLLTVGAAIHKKRV